MKATNSTSLFALNRDVRMIWVGILYFAISIFIPPLFYVIMKIIYKQDKTTPNFTYKLMNFILLLQLLQGICHFITSPILVFPALLTEFEVIVRILGCMANTSWIGELPMMALLAICRVLIFANSMEIRITPLVVKMIVVCIVCWVLFVFIAGCITQNLMFSPPSWGYDFSVPYAELFDMLEIFLTVPCLAISYFAYLTIIFLICSKRNRNGSNQSRKNEIRILIQSTFVTTYMACLVVVWHPVIFTMVSFIDMTKFRNIAIANGFWILHSYCHPIIILIFHKTIRIDCLLKLKLRYNSSTQQRVWKPPRSS